MPRLAALFMLAIAVAAAPAAAQSLAEQPLGAKLAREVGIGPKKVLLPDGEWLVVAKLATTSRVGALAGVPFLAAVLVDVRDAKLARLVHVYGNLEPNNGIHWVDDPCRIREDILRHSELGRNDRDQFCVQLNHFTQFLEGATGVVFKETYTWLKANGVQFSLNALGVTYSRVDRAWQHRVTYYFNPDFDGVTPSAIRQWAASEWHRNHIAREPERKRYVDALNAWIDQFAPFVRAAYDGTEPPDARIPRLPFPRVARQQ